MSIQTLYTSAELTATFPVDTTAHINATCKLVDHLVTNGVISDRELRQLEPLIGAAIDAHLEPAQVASAVYSGTAGTITRSYYAIPIYPLIPGSAANVQGRYLNQLTEAPGGGRITSKNIVGGPNDMQKGFIGGSAAVPPTAVTVANTAQTLDQSDYVTVVAPPASASKIAGVTFDIFAKFTVTQNGQSVTTQYLVGKSVAPGATVIDSNQTFQAYTLPAHAQFGVDTTVTPAVPIQGTLTVLPTN